MTNEQSGQPEQTFDVANATEAEALALLLEAFPDAVVLDGESEAELLYDEPPRAQSSH